MDDEIRDLLLDVHEVLKDRWFIEGDDDQYNDDEIIDLDNRVTKLLEERREETE